MATVVSPARTTRQQSLYSRADEKIVRSVSSLKLDESYNHSKLAINRNENVSNSTLRSPGASSRSISQASNHSVHSTPRKISISSSTPRKTGVIQTTINESNSQPTNQQVSQIRKSSVTRVEPPSPIASASPNARRFRSISVPTNSQTINQSNNESSGNQSLDKNDLPSPVKRALKKQPHELKKPLFSPNYHSTSSSTSSNSQLPSIYKRKPTYPTRSATIIPINPALAQAAKPVRVHSVPVARTVGTSKAIKQSVQPAVSSAPSPSSPSNNQTDEDIFDPLLFIAQLPPLSSVARAGLTRMAPKIHPSPKITLALDLDETLVHCSVSACDKFDVSFSVDFHGMSYTVSARFRPYLCEFLQHVARHFEVVVFTASQQVYADRLLDIIDPNHTLIAHRVFRDSCVVVDGNFLKDLNVLERDLKHCCIVDNSIQAFGFQLNNGIPIESWFEDPHDDELMKLIPLLDKLKDADDVRPIIRDAFKLKATIEQLK